MTSPAEPAVHHRRPTDMLAITHVPGGRKRRNPANLRWRDRRPRPAAVAGITVIAAGLLIAGCDSGGAFSASAAAPAAHQAAGKAAVGQAVGQPPSPAAAGTSSSGPGGNRLTLLSPAGQSIIYTASLTVRAKSVSNAASRAAQLTAAAGGYVSAENTHLNRAHPARSSVSLQLKIPVAVYATTLSQLSSQLGTRVSLSRQAKDVTQAVADVTSRVASAHAAIAQLRALLARAGSVVSLLQVQNQIDQQESSLESLLSQQRVLTHATAYATVSLLLVSPPLVAHPARAGGFTSGLAAGWRALRATVSWLLTGAGAALPFAVIVALAGLLGYRGWRWLARHRAPHPAE